MHMMAVLVLAHMQILTLFLGCNSRLGQPQQVPEIPSGKKEHSISSQYEREKKRSFANLVILKREMR